MTITQQKLQGPPERLPRSPVVGLSKPRLLQIVGPGLSSGAAGHDLTVTGLTSSRATIQVKLVLSHAETLQEATVQEA